MKEDDSNYRVKLDVWSTKADEMLAELLSLMGARLGYDFDKVKIKKGIYSPRGHDQIELESSIIRKKMVEIMSGNNGFPIYVYKKQAVKDGRNQGV